MKRCNFKQELKEGTFKTMSEPEFIKHLNTIKHKHLEEARAICILLYCTGARPTEALNIRMNDISHCHIGRKEYVRIKITNLYNQERHIKLLYEDVLAQELFWYAASKYNNRYIFNHFRGKGIINRIYNGQCDKRANIHTRLVYHIKMWFGFSPSYFRHNRLLLLGQSGCTIEDWYRFAGRKPLKNSYQDIKSVI